MRSDIHGLSHRHPRVRTTAIVSIRSRQTSDRLPAFLKGAFPEILGRIRLLGVGPTGAPFVIYHEFTTERFDAEVSVPIAEPIIAAGRMQSRVLPAMTVARTLHVGPYEQLSDAYAALSGWVTEHGYEVPARTSSGISTVQAILDRAEPVPDGARDAHRAPGRGYAGLTLHCAGVLIPAAGRTPRAPPRWPCRARPLPPVDRRPVSGGDGLEISRRSSPAACPRAPR